jgi:glycosyltransferase involved in cell wall biosynthesis
MEPTAQPSVTVVILTFNEELNVEAAIASVGDWGARVIVVDSGSTDETVTRAQASGAVVWIRIPENGFLIAEQRTWALKELAAIGVEWVLFLDADERATPSFLHEVSAAIALGTCNGYYAAPMFMYQGTWLKRFKGYPNWHPRIARTSVEIAGSVWEDFPAGVTTGKITEPYLHFVNSKGLADWVGRHARYATWEARPPTKGRPERRPALRTIGRTLGPLRPFAAVFHHLVLRGGLLDGGSVWSYARRQFMYELMIVEARRERLADSRALPR